MSAAFEGGAALQRPHLGAAEQRVSGHVHAVDAHALAQQAGVELLEVVVMATPHVVCQLVDQRLADALIVAKALHALPMGEGQCRQAALPGRMHAINTEHLCARRASHCTPSMPGRELRGLHYK